MKANDSSTNYHLIYYTCTYTHKDKLFAVIRSIYNVIICIWHVRTKYEYAGTRNSRDARSQRPNSISSIDLCAITRATLIHSRRVCGLKLCSFVCLVLIM